MTWPAFITQSKDVNKCQHSLDRSRSRRSNSVRSSSSLQTGPLCWSSMVLSRDRRLFCRLHDSHRRCTKLRDATRLDCEHYNRRDARDPAQSQTHTQIGVRPSHFLVVLLTRVGDQMVCQYNYVRISPIMCLNVIILPFHRRSHYILQSAVCPIICKSGCNSFPFHDTSRCVSNQ